jgi:hypothetical protein
MVLLAGVPVSQLEPYFAPLESVPCLLVCRAWNREMDRELVWTQRLRKQAARDGDSDQSLWYSFQWLQRENRSSMCHRFEIFGTEDRADTNYVWTSIDPTRSIWNQETWYLRRYPGRLRLDLKFLREFARHFGLPELSAQGLDEFDDLGALANRSKCSADEPTAKLVLRGNLVRTSQEPDAENCSFSFA